jgi:DNA-directed RNA polymerase I subunit RPA1
MFQLLRAQCANCHKLRLNASKIRLVLIKLKLIELGDVAASDALDNLVAAPVVFNSEQDLEGALSGSEIEQKLMYYELLYESKKSSHVNASVKTQQRLVIDSFVKSVVACKKCENCGSFSPPLRKDGYSKIFEKALQKRLRKSMSGMRIKLKVNRLHKYSWFVSKTHWCVLHCCLVNTAGARISSRKAN